MDRHIIHLCPNIIIFRVCGKTFGVYLSDDEIQLDNFRYSVSINLRNINLWPYLLNIFYEGRFTKNLWNKYDLRNIQNLKECFLHNTEIVMVALFNFQEKLMW